METRNPVDGYFSGKFPAICHYCWIIAAGSRNTFKNFEKFLRFCNNDPYG